MHKFQKNDVVRHITTGIVMYVEADTDPNVDEIKCSYLDPADHSLQHGTYHPAELVLVSK